MASPLQIKNRHHCVPARSNPEQLLAQAVAERDAFLEKYPQYKTFQQEIDIILDKAGTSENRMAVLALLLEAKLIQLHEELQHFNRMLWAVAWRSPILNS